MRKIYLGITLKEIKNLVLKAILVVNSLLLFNNVFSQSTTCAGATNVTPVFAASCTPSLNFNVTTGGSSAPAFATCATAVNSANNWGKFTAIAPTATISYDPATGLDAMIFAYSGTCTGTLTQIGCIDNVGNGVQENLTLTGLTTGVVYYFRIVRYNSASAMTGTICISSPVPTITTSTISGSPFCVTPVTSIPVPVSFTTSSATFSGNTFTAQLSNAAGGFGTPINIGTLVSNGNSGTINAVIPANTISGTGYRIRVISNNPAATGSSSNAISINLAANSIAPAATQNIISGANGTGLTVTEQSTPSSRTWFYGTTSGGPYSTNTGINTASYTPNFPLPGTYYIVCVSNFACAIVTSNEVRVNVSPSYKSQFISSNTGATTWCAGETRNVSIQIKNIGTATWTDASPDINVGVKWNTNGTSWTDYHIRVDAGNLAPGATGTYILPITASNFVPASGGYTTPLGAGTNNLIFDVVYEGVSWFGDNGGGVGPGNVKFTSANQTIVALPGTPTGTAAQTFCTINNPTVANLLATGTNIKWYAASSGGTALVATTPLVSGTTYYASQTNGSGCESIGRFAVTATVSNPSAPTGSTAQSFCAINNPTVAALVAGGTAIKWYSVASGGTALASTTTLVNGTHYYASQTVATCEGTARLDVTVTLNNPAAPTGALTQSFCTIDNPTVASLTATGTTIKWYATPGGGTVLAGTTALVNGTHYYASQTVGSCEGIARFDVTVTLNNPAAPAGSSVQTFCAIDNPTITNLVATGTGTIKWYTASSGGTLLTAATALVNNTHYYASQTVAGCEGISRLDVTASISGPVAPAGASAQSFCSDANPTVANLTTTGSGILWYGASTGGTALATSTPLVDNQHYYASQNIGGCESATRLDVQALIHTVVTITAQPNPSQTICASQSASFSVTTTGEVFSYQWYFGSTALVNNSNVNGAQSATLLLDQVYPADIGNYHVVVTGISPCGPVTSADAYLDVNVNIVVTTPPAAQTVCVGSTVTFTVVANTTGLTYQWRKGTTNLVDGGIVAGALTDVLTLTGVTTADAGNYNVILSDGSAGCPNTNSVNAALTINPTSVGGVVSASTDVCTGINGGTLTLGAHVGNVVWQSSLDGTSYTDISPLNTTNSQSYSNLIQTTWYRAKVTNGVCPPDFSAPAMITVNPLPTITPDATAADICFSTGAQTTTLAYTATTEFPTTYSITWSGTFAVVTNAALPAGSITISVPANAAPGTYTGTITVRNANGCLSSPGVQFTVTIIGNATIARTSGTGSDAQTVCINNAITPITYNIGGTGSGASITSGSLPGGVSGTYNAGVFTISGTPTVSGAYSYTVTTTGPCATPFLSGTITVNDDATVTLTSAPSTVSQTLCISTPLTTITYAIGGGGTGATITGLPAGVSGSYNAGTKVYTINGTPSVSGTFNYTVTTTGPCIKPVATGTIIVQENSTIALSSVAGTNNQTRCINVALANITFTIGGGATGASVTGLPAGITGVYNAGVFTISGTPAVSGSFPYSVTTSGPCVNPSSGGTITVNADATIILTSAPATTSQTFCINTPVTPITYAIGGGGTGATTTGLPTGVTGAYNAGTQVYTISGTPSVSGTFNYTVTTTGPCIKPALTGSITVQANSTLTRTSPAATTAQIVCINNAIANIVYTGGGGATGATVTGLPAGVTFAIAGATLTISGTPTVFGAFNYTVTTTGPCVNASLSGTITVNDDATITLTSAPATTSQTLCVSTPITAITYAIGSGGTGASTTGLPAGVTGSYNAGTRIFTISGTPTAFGTFNYTVTTTGPCIKPALTGTITVTPNATLTRTSAAATTSQTICINTPLTNITYSIGGSGTGASITAGALPAGITGSYAGGVFTISGTPTVSGAFSYMVTTSGPCVNVSSSGTITVNADATIALTSAAATTSQTPCIGTPINAITYQLGGGATGAGTTGLPTGVTGNYNSGTKIYTISGSPSVSGTFNYTVTTTGPCIKPALGGSIIVTPNATIALTSAAGTKAQTICTNTPLANITYGVGGSGTGATITGLPAGVSGIYNAGTRVYTISGAPTAPGTFNYTITTTGPCTQDSETGTITVKAIATGTLAAAETSGLVNNDDKICSGATVTFTATPGFSLYEFYINGVVVRPADPSNTYNNSTLSSGDVVSVKVFNSLSCATFFNTKTITVYTLPSPTLIATENSGTPNNNSICAGDNITFTATGGNNYNFKINGSSQVSGPSATYSSTSINNNDVVTAEVTNSNGCIATSGSQTINVSPIPNGMLSASSTSICPGDNITFTATGGDTYQFRINGAITQPFSATATFSRTTFADNDIVTVDVSNAAGCTVTYTPGIAINVNPSPTGTLTATENSGTANDNSICANSPVTFTFSSTGYTNYNFIVNAISKQSGVSNSYTTSTLAASDVVSVVVTSGTCSAIFSAPTITIAPSPTGTLTASPAAICAGDNVTFTASPTYTNYNFRVNGVSAQNGSGNTFSSSAFIDQDVITVDVTNSNTCVTTFNSVTLTVSPLPTGTLVAVENSGNTPDDGIICTGAPVVFTAPIGFSNYNFILNGLSVQNGPGRTYSNPALVSGDKIDVAVTGAGGCIALLNQVALIINPLPTVGAITGPAGVCVTGTITLADATTGGVWNSLNTSVATISSTGVVTGIAPGIATINYTFTNTNNCSNTVSTTVTVNAPPLVDAITGNFNVCTASNSQLSDNTPGGLWSSSNTAFATVDASGLVSGIAPGTATISYTVTDGNGCTTTVTEDVVVTNLPSVAPITTTAPGFDVCVGGTLPLKDATPSGTWSSSDTTLATVNSSGIVTGVLAGTVDINYFIATSCGGNATARQTITVHAAPSATINYPGAPFCTTSGPITVLQTGTTGGTYTATGGLTVDPATGTITPGTTGGTFTISYSIPASNGCGIYTTTTTVIINTAPTATIAYAGPYCTSSAPANVTRTGIAGGSYTSTAGLTINNGTGLITPATSTNGSYLVTYTIAASGGCAQFTTTTTVVITAAPSATITYTGSPFCKNAGAASVNRLGTPGGTYSAPAGLSLDAVTGTITPATSTGGTYTVTYSFTAGGGCPAFSTSTSVTITDAPTGVAGPNLPACSNAGAVNITAGSSATNYSSTVWTSSGNGTFLNAGSLTTASYTPSGTDISSGSVILTLTASGNVGCTAAASTKILTINPPPAAFIITPVSASICTGDVQPLSASASTSSTASQTFSSGTVNLAIPEGNRAHTINVSGIPTGAIINSVSVNFNITHGYDDDLIINLRAPNNNTLNLVNQRGGSGDNFVNTTVSSASVNPLSGSAPFTNTYTPDAGNNVGTPNSNVSAFSSLTGTPNGNWVFNAEDVTDCHGSFLTCLLGGGSYYTGTLNSWSITFNYTIPNSPLLVTWSPMTNLYTDPGATIAYAGQKLSTVYTKSTTAVTTNFIATATNVANCSTSQNVTVIVNPKPVVSIAAIYCTPAPAGKVRLTATSVPAGTSYLWSTGATTQTVDVDIAGSYDVTVFGAGTCPGKASITVANELVVNGDFEAGNSGFITPPLGANQYTYVADNAANPSELVPEGLYGVGPDAHTYHNGFWGHDHTTGTGNFMIINGFPNGNPQPIVWQETVNVLPNTTYYFSAWGLSVNASSPFAQLQFNVNGAQVGTNPLLPAGVNSNANSGWTRFYGTWNSGPTTTTAIISITDLQNSTGGNDFGLDDISFGTLSTFLSLETAPGTDAQTVCKNTPVQTIVYNVGNGNVTGPTVTGLPVGMNTPVFAGDKLTITGTPTTAGTYTYTITTTGCNPTTMTGTITVQEQKITLSSGSATQSLCINTPVSIGFTLSGNANNASVTGLAGATTTLVGKNFTITWTPSAAGPFPYSVITSGTGCTPDTAKGAITVQSQTITLNTAAATTNQTVCVNTPIANIRYAVGGTGTGATISWSPSVPTGIIGNFNSGLFTISGTPTSSTGSPYTYIVTTSGTCATVTATGTLTITPAATLTLTSGAGTDAQSACNNLPIANITYSVNNATGAAITSGAFPTGVTGNFSGGIYTISGTPTGGGTFSYTITTTGGCATGTATGTIIVQAQSIALTSGVASPSICAGSPMTPNIAYTIGGAATGATISGLPAGIAGSLSSNVFTISGTTNDPAGAYLYTISTTGSSCTPATITGTITIQSAAIGGTLTSVSVCSGGAGGTLTLSGNSYSPVRWEYSTNGGATWIVIANTAITQSYPTLISPRQYRAVINKGCGDVFSTVATVGIHNYWVGLTSSDWNTASNWSDNQVPSTSCPMVHIPGGTPNQPVLTTGTATIINLQIDATATLTVTGLGILQVQGGITNSGMFNVTNGTLVFNGSSAQSIAGSMFKDSTLRNLTLSNSAGLTVSNVSGNLLKITGTLAFGTVNNATLHTGDNLVLVSTATGTARVATIGGTGNSFDGYVTVERYYPMSRSWRLVTSPLSNTGNIYNSWQNSGVYTVGRGEFVTGPNPTIVNGLDTSYRNNPSMKGWLPLTSSYRDIINTKTELLSNNAGLPNIASNIGYFTFVRGDRSRSPNNTIPGNMNNTTLSSKGFLQTGNQTFNFSSGAGTYALVGNPYASSVDFSKVSKTNVYPSRFHAYDPSLGTVGAFVVMEDQGGGVFMPINLNTSTQRNFIQSSQAFFVEVTGTAASIQFHEGDKSADYNPALFRPAVPVDQQPSLRTTLYLLNDNKTTILADGTLVQFDPTFSDKVDILDAMKYSNINENLGILRYKKLLAVERRPVITADDTIFVYLSRTTQRNYRFEIEPLRLDPSLTAFLEDSYTGSRTPLDIKSKSVHDFTINGDAKSAVANRFRIVFKQVKPVVLPVTFTSIQAVQQVSNISVDWTVENELNTSRYEVEKSTDGTNYVKVNTTTAIGANSSSTAYNWIDLNAVSGNNYYRVRSIGKDGQAAYSRQVVVKIGKGSEGIRVYPNPVTTGIIGVEFKNMAGGIYKTRLLNGSGQTILSKLINHASGTSMETVKPDYKLASGLYQLEVTAPDNAITVVKVIVK